MSYDLSAMKHGWRGALIALALPYIFVALLALSNSMPQLPGKAAAAKTKGVAGPQLTPTPSFEKRREPRNTNHLDCLVEIA